MNHETSLTFNHLDYLDGWRGLAIVFLLIGHFFPVPGINLGTVGVNLFFVLSGYLMGQLLFIKETALPVFYRRRISRIVPAHVFFILAMTLFYVFTGKPVDGYETLAALFFVNNYFQGELGKSVMPLGHIWSLSVEEHSYLLLSLVALAARQGGLNARRTVAVLALCFSAMGFWYWRHYAGPELVFGKWIRSEVSAYGIFVSTFLLLFFAKRKIPRLPVLIYPMLLCTGIMMHWWSIPAPFRTTLGVGLLALAVNLLPNAPPYIQQVLAFKPLRFMGLWSFSIYLWQQPFYLAAYKGIIPGYVAISLAMVCGTLSFYLLERPLRTYLNRVWLKTGQPRLNPV